MKNARRLILFRADASPEIGTGHVVRCAALAAALKSRGADILFVSRYLGDAYRDELTNQGFGVTMLEGEGSSPQNADADAMATIQAMQGYARPAWLVVDHYGLAADWHRRLRPHVPRIAVIDDLANRPHDCDLLLDQNVLIGDDRRYEPWVPATCRQLLGPGFALLRPQFAEARRTLRWRDGPVRRLLICCGGGDADNLTERAVEAFLDVQIEDVHAEVIVGAAYPHWERLVAQHGDCVGLTIERNVADMAARMARSDLFLGAGGSMTWERAALGLPGITIAIAPNQQRMCEDLATIGAGIHLGDAATQTVSGIAGAFRTAVARPAWRADAARKLMAICDGLGVERVCTALGPCS